MTKTDSRSSAGTPLTVTRARLLEKKLEDRFQSADEFAEALNI